MLPQPRNAKDYQQPPEARRGKERVFPTAFRGKELSEVLIALSTP